MGTASFPGVK